MIVYRNNQIKVIISCLAFFYFQAEGGCKPNEVKKFTLRLWLNFRFHVFYLSF